MRPDERKLSIIMSDMCRSERADECGSVFVFFSDNLTAVSQVIRSTASRTDVIEVPAPVLAERQDFIDHVIDGQVVSTRYGHMQYGSLQVTQGQRVTAGQIIGKVGQTGKATGPHLHLEVLLGGTAHTDPIEWLKEHTNGTHTVG